MLGDLICVENVKELKKYESSITSEVMVYKNCVQKATNPDTYKSPFIGRDSIKKRIELLKEEIKLIEDKNLKNKNELSILNNIKNTIMNSNVDELLKADNYWSMISSKEKSINNLTEEIKSDEMNTGLMEIAGRIDTVKKNLEKVNADLADNGNKIRNNSTRKGQLEQRLIDNKTQLDNEKNSFNELISFLIISQYDSRKQKYTINGRLNDEVINKDYEHIKNYNNSVNNRLIEVMQKYTATYKPSLIPIIENIKDYVNEYYDLKNRGVVQYEMDAKEAYERAEISFREDFISKLKEKIEKSQKMLDKINNNLALHPFGNDEEKYKFYYAPTKDSEFFNYYRIIMSNKLMESNNLFTEVLDDKDYSFMKDLFEKISMETDSAKAENDLKRYLDYRNYMNYDIKITNKHGDETYFSKINREKSGGETQTPFYIVMASCFDELMNKDSNKFESTCQVVFDEAFNNMDESRIKSLMEFYKKLNIQIVIIVPSNRISAISPYMDTLVGITKIKNHPHVHVVGKYE